jgi:transcriptional regulator with XRE-family HTH domain
MFYDVFAELCEKRGIKPSKAAEECGINKSNVSNWKNNGYVPRGDALNKIADYFCVSTDYLLGNEQKEKPAQAQAENPELDQAFFRVMKSAQDKGYSAHDIELALDFIKRARERDQK